MGPVTSAADKYPLSPYVHFDRDDWARLRDHVQLDLTGEEVSRLAGLVERLDVNEIEQVYLPLSRLLTFYVDAAKTLHRVTTDFLDEPRDKCAFVIGVAGSVAVGKSTTSRVLRELLTRWPSTPDVALITTDGFLYPNAELERRGLMTRKGFPESYDRAALMQFLAAVKAGVPEVSAPVYSHLTYDIVPGDRIVVRQPDVLIVEGLNVLQAPQPTRAAGGSIAVSDFFDFSVYVDADPADIRRWYVERFLRLRETSFSNPQSYFHRYASLSDDEAHETALRIWRDINLVNLVENVEPTRSRATLVLTKGAGHAVTAVRLRKL
jgi:type I pantothenate kinase